MKNSDLRKQRRHIAAAVDLLCLRFWLIVSTGLNSFFIVGGDHYTNVGPDAGEFADDVLVAPLNMLELADIGKALSGQTGDEH